MLFNVFILPIPMKKTSTNPTKTYTKEISRRLGRWLPDAECALHFKTPLELLVATILSAQCTDVRVNIVTAELFKKYRSASDYLTVPVETLENDIHSTGFYRNKAKNIRGACKMLLEEYDGKLPRDIETLTKFPGVGRKTANVVLGTAFGVVSGVVVDTHVLRLSGRLGLTMEKTAEKIERDLMQLFPKSEWIAIGHQLVHLGRRICLARKPHCSECPLSDICPKIIANKSRNGAAPND